MPQRLVRSGAIKRCFKNGASNSSNLVGHFADLASRFSIRRRLLHGVAKRVRKTLQLMLTTGFCWFCYRFCHVFFLKFLDGRCTFRPSQRYRPKMAKTHQNDAAPSHVPKFGVGKAIECSHAIERPNLALHFELP